MYRTRHCNRLYISMLFWRCANFRRVENDIYDPSARIIKNHLNSTIFWTRHLNSATRRLNCTTRQINLATRKILHYVKPTNNNDLHWMIDITRMNLFHSYVKTRFDNWHDCNLNANYIQVCDCNGWKCNRYTTPPPPLNLVLHNNEVIYNEYMNT